MAMSRSAGSSNRRHFGELGHQADVEHVLAKLRFGERLGFGLRAAALGAFGWLTRCAGGLGQGLLKAGESIAGDVVLAGVGPQNGVFGRSAAGL